MKFGDEGKLYKSGQNLYHFADPCEITLLSEHVIIYNHAMEQNFLFQITQNVFFLSTFNLITVNRLLAWSKKQNY